MAQLPVTDFDEIRRFKSNDSIETLLERNRNWAQKLSALRPTLFPTLANKQQPLILWIGCSDSRVPETTLLDLFPGEVFVHRNIANVLPLDDLSSLSVIQYAVEKLKVKHIIVCGHYDCGGVKAALDNTQLGLIDNWIKHVRVVRAQNQAELDKLEDPIERFNKLVELNVIAQVHNLQRGANVQAAIQGGLQVHGAVYHVAHGYLEFIKVPEDPYAEAFRVKLK